MVSLYDSFAMFPGPHHSHQAAAAAAAAAGHSAAATPPHHAHHALLGRQGPPPPPGHHQVVHHGQHHHHQITANQQAAYFGAYSHPHWTGAAGGNAVQHNPAAAAAAAAAQFANEQQHQFGWVTSDTGNSLHHPAAAAAAAAGLYGAQAAGLSPARTPVTSVGYEEWANSPGGVNNASNNNQSQGVVSSPDSSPAFQHHQHGGLHGVQQPGSPTEQHPAYGKLFLGGSGADFIPPYQHLSGHLQQQHQHQQDLVQQQQHRMNPTTVGPAVTGHHSPDSGLAGSDGLSSAGSPAQQQQNMLGSSAGINMNNMQGGQQAVGMNQQQQGSMAGPNNNNNNRSQQSRSPYEWMKKPSYHNNVNPGESSNHR